MRRISVLLVALLACATARVAVVAAASACDGISCGMGSCKEVPPLLPFLSNVSTYSCDCYPGWLNFVPLVTLTACYIPTSCLGMDCGEGTCVEERGKPMQCQCNPGATNLRNDPSFPCTTNCVIGQDGCPVLGPPPPPPQPSSSAPPGCVCLQNLLLLALIAALHVVW